jgi:stress response protein SCP2
MPSAAPMPSAPAAPAPPPAHSGEVSLVKGRSVSLQKGQRVSLQKEDGALTFVRMGLGWDPIKRRGLFGGREAEIDLDASALMFADRELADIVFYNHLTSNDGSVQHMGDNRTGAGDGDDETILIDLTRVPAHISTILLIVTSYEGQTFEQVTNAFCRLVDNHSGAELARYTLAGGMPFTAVAMNAIYREGAAWKLRAIGEGMQARTPLDAVPQVARFL